MRLERGNIVKVAGLRVCRVLSVEGRVVRVVGLEDGKGEPFRVGVGDVECVVDDRVSPPVQPPPLSPAARRLLRENGMEFAPCGYLRTIDSGKDDHV